MGLTIRRNVRCRLPVRRLRQLARAVARHRPAAAGGERLTAPALVVVGTPEMRRLNRTYRRDDRPTDVLSFAGGDLFVCWPVAVRQARARGHRAADEVALLFVHGCLHLLGYDHERSVDRRRMQRAEAGLLGHVGLIRP